MGYVYLNTTSSTYHTITSVTGVVSCMIFDSYYKSRRLYWSVPGSASAADGNIYYMIVDHDFTVYSLLSIVGQNNLVNPTGLAIHYIQRKYLYNVF